MAWTSMAAVTDLPCGTRYWWAMRRRSNKGVR